MTEHEEGTLLAKHFEAPAGGNASTTKTSPRRWTIVTVKLAIMMLLCFLVIHLAKLSPTELLKVSTWLSSSSSPSCSDHSTNRTFDGLLRFSNGVHITTPPSSSHFDKHKKWAVTTSHGREQISEAILQFVKQEDWAIVIVGDENLSLPGIRGPTIVILDAAAQQSLKAEYSEMFDLLPWNHFGRKNAGYLYAILHGAEMIWGEYEKSRVVNPRRQKDAFNVHANGIRSMMSFISHQSSVGFHIEISFLHIRILLLRFRRAQYAEG